MVLLTAGPAGADPGRQLCLTCHPAHHARLGGCTVCHRGNPASERKNIAHQRLIAGRYARFTLANDRQLRHGIRLLEQYACRRCHVSAGRGNRLATSLDRAAVRKTPEQLADSIQRPVAAMPDFGLDDKRTTQIVNALLAGAQGRTADDDTPVAVHFNIAAQTGRDIFSKRCGACHRLLSQRSGALGRGNIGPNLSGLLSVYYPRTFRDSETWTSRILGAWLKNPREVRPWALMLPVTLSDAELSELVSILQVAADLQS